MDTSQNTRPPCRILVFVATSFLLYSACGSTVRGATEANLARAQNLVPNGAESYRQNCMECHGGRGEGTQTAPAIMGPDALPIRRQKQIDTALLADRALRDEQERTTVPGSAAGKDVRPHFNTAQDIFDYLRNEHTRVEKMANLTDEQVWQALSFVMATNGANVQGGLSSQNAASVANQPPE